MAKSREERLKDIMSKMAGYLTAFQKERFGELAAAADSSIENSSFSVVRSIIEISFKLGPLELEANTIINDSISAGVYDIDPKFITYYHFLCYQMKCMVENLTNLMKQQHEADPSSVLREMQELESEGQGLSNFGDLLKNLSGVFDPPEDENNADRFENLDFGQNE